MTRRPRITVLKDPATCAIKRSGAVKSLSELKTAGGLSRSAGALFVMTRRPRITMPKQPATCATQRSGAVRSFSELKTAGDFPDWWGTFCYDEETANHDAKATGDLCYKEIWSG